MSMFNNPNHIRHFPRQPNVQLTVVDHRGESMSMYNKLVTADMFVIQGVVMLEVREFADMKSAEPQKVSYIINPVKWSQLAAPDPEHIAAL